MAEATWTNGHGRAADPDDTKRRADPTWLARGYRAALIVCGYLALLLIPVVLAADFERSVKAALTGLLGVTPLLTKLAAVALLGKPAFKLIKKVVARLRGGGEPQRPRRH
jgi:hypothetical protein